MAQLVAHLHGMQGVRGSSPLRSTLGEKFETSPKCTRISAMIEPSVVTGSALFCCVA